MVIDQNEVWVVALLGMGAVALVFLWFIREAGKPARGPARARTPRLEKRTRLWLFAALIVVSTGISWASLRHYPIPPQHAVLAAPQVINVIGRQWMWELSGDHITAGVPVEFRVTSGDVNHDFAVYDPEGRIVVQTQAMPGYFNKIVHTFTEPGTYRIRCLEYCGLAHAQMESDLIVVAPAAQGAST